MKFSALLAFGLASFSAAAAASIQTPAHHTVHGKDYDRVFIIVMENQDFSSVAADSYFQSIPAKHKGVLLTKFNALAHPSQPNYIGMISGTTDGCTDDSDITLNRNTIVDLLEAKGISWKTYQEAYTGNCNNASIIGTYRRKHNPFISFANISGNSKRCANIVPATELATDIAENNVPQFVFYTPDMNNDGHDTPLSYASTWAEGFIEPLLTHHAVTKKTLFVLTWDENKSYTTPNQIYTVLFGPAVHRHNSTDDTIYDLYSILKSVEDNWNLGNLGQNDVNAVPLKLRD